MERAQDGRILVVSDTNVLINFLLVGRLDLLCQHKEYRFVATEHARAEITDAAQRAELETAISAWTLGETSLTDPREIDLFATLNAFLGRGESAAIAVAASRGWVVATDDHRARREIERRIERNHLLTTPGVLLRCILRGGLTIADADGIKDQLSRRSTSSAAARDHPEGGLAGDSVWRALRHCRSSGSLEGNASSLPLFVPGAAEERARGTTLRRPEFPGGRWRIPPDASS
jgi:predicted nucleic acid-binding protein